jgi:hypothetical protein
MTSHTSTVIASLRKYRDKTIQIMRRVQATLPGERYVQQTCNYNYSRRADIYYSLLPLEVIYQATTAIELPFGYSLLQLEVHLPYDYTKHKASSPS